MEKSQNVGTKSAFTPFLKLINRKYYLLSPIGKIMKLRVCLDTAYFAEIEKLLLKVLQIKVKVIEIVQ